MFKNSEPSLFDIAPYNTWVKASLTDVLIAVGWHVERILEAFWLVSLHLLPGVPVAVKSSGNQELSGHHSSFHRSLCVSAHSCLLDMAGLTGAPLPRVWSA